MQLNIKNRLLIVNLLPKEGSILEQQMCKEIGTKVELSPELIEHIELKKDENNIHWNAEKEEILEVCFSAPEVSILKGIVEKLDKEGKVNPENLDLCLEIKKL